jgi:hypothetical protein
MEKQITITLEQAIELYKTNEKLRPTLLNTFSLAELENKEIKCWEDLKEIEGYWISNTSCIVKSNNVATIYMSQNIFANEKQAESSLAKSQLSQLLKEFNGNWKPDWKINSERDLNMFVIIKYINIIQIMESLFFSSFLVFKTKEKAQLFLSTHKELIEQYLGDL